MEAPVTNDSTSSSTCRGHLHRQSRVSTTCLRSEFITKDENNNDLYEEEVFCDQNDSKSRLVVPGVKTRREKLEDLRRTSMQRCGSDSLEHTDVYQNILYSYEDVIEDGITECDSGDCILDDNGELTEHHEGVCRTRLLSDSDKEAFLRRDLVLTELLDSEKNYVVDLGFVVDKLLPLMTEEHVTESLVYGCNDVFLNIADIYAFHVKSFHDEIEKCFENPDLLDDAFTKYEEQLTQLYTFYCGKKPTADESLMDYEEELNMLFNKMFPDVKLSIKDFLIKPVQRLMKYQLLLTSIKKYGIKAGRPATYLDAAIAAMERVPKEANDAMHVGLITGYEGVGCNLKHLLMHGQLEVAFGNRKPRSMHVFLFETVCLFTDKASKLVPEYKCVFSDDNSCLSFTTNGILTFIIIFRKHVKTDIYKCEAPTEDDMEQWVCKIRQAMSFKTMQQRKNSIGRQLTIEIAPADVQQDESDSLEIGEAVVKAMMGHPRRGIMSDRLKCNIEMYIATEFIIPTISPDMSPEVVLQQIRTDNNLVTDDPFEVKRDLASHRRSVSNIKTKDKKSRKDKRGETAKKRSKSLIHF